MAKVSIVLSIVAVLISSAGVFYVREQIRESKRQFDDSGAKIVVGFSIYPGDLQIDGHPRYGVEVTNHGRLPARIRDWGFSVMVPGDYVSREFLYGNWRDYALGPSLARGETHLLPPMDNVTWSIEIDEVSIWMSEFGVKRLTSFVFLGDGTFVESPRIAL